MNTHRAGENCTAIAFIHCYTLADSYTAIHIMTISEIFIDQKHGNFRICESKIII